MRKYTIAITSILFLSACSTTVKKEGVDKPKNKSMQVIAEVCVNAGKKEAINIVTTERTGSTISSHSYIAVLENKTVDNMSIFNSFVGKSDTLTYVTVENILDATTYYLFKRNFNDYPVNQWGQWENPDYLFKEGTQYNFLAMSNSPIDGTSNLLKINFKNQPGIKIRFQLINLPQKTISDETIIARKVESCM